MSLFDRAQKLLDGLLTVPDELTKELELGESALAEGYVDEAERRFRQTIDRRPMLARAHVGWGRALLEGGDVDGAKLALAEAQRLALDDPQAMLLSAHLALWAGELGTALARSRDAARRLAPVGGLPLADACSLRAEIELRRGRPDRAARELRKALAADPDVFRYKRRLLESLVAAGERAPAIRLAREISKNLTHETLLAHAGLALDALGEPDDARDALAKLGPSPKIDPALLTRVLDAQARRAIEHGQLDDAEQLARRAVAVGGGGSALSSLGELLILRGRDAEAAEVLLAAGARATSTEREQLYARAAAVVPLDDDAATRAVAETLERALPHSAWPLLVGQLLDRGELTEARRLAEAGGSTARALGFRTSLVLARLELAEHARDRDGHGSEHVDRALALLDGAETSFGIDAHDRDRARARELRRDALRALWQRGDHDVDLARAIDGVAAFARTRGLDRLALEADALRDELDRPLLLAILGEFNAGKSTLVNAFLGASIAPTGILPTTATLNVLRGGAERRVRVVRQDGSTREGSHEDVRALLADAEEAEQRVDRVEIVLPSELLERVWILDTPGSNAPNAEHEALAREGLRRADAALWVFDAGQAGKASEGAVLAMLRASRREVIPIVNKVDRLKEGELARVVAALETSMPDLRTAPVAISAKAALQAKQAGDDDALEASGFAGLMRTIDAQIFERSRLLKRRACAGRLIGLLETALATEHEFVETHEARIASIEARRRAWTRDRAAAEGAIDRAIDAVDEGQREAIADAAREVLAFVRPRANVFQTNSADPEDRAFLVELLESRLEAVVDRARGGLVDEITQLATTAGFDDTVRTRVALAVTPAMTMLLGHQAGFLAGGAARRFFDEVLSHLELAEAPIAAALSDLRSSPREALRESLSRAVRGLVAELDFELAASRAKELADRESTELRTYAPLRALADVMGALVTS